MILESQIKPADRDELRGIRIALEMATISEWVASRPDEDPDCLFLLFVEPLDDRGEFYVTCNCDRGKVNEVCPEAVALIDKFREPNSSLMIQLHRRDFYRPAVDAEFAR